MAVVGEHGDALRIFYDSAEVKHRHAVGTLPGVAVLAAGSRNPVGLGLLLAGTGGQTVAWKAPGSESAGPYVNVAAGGEYLLEDGEDPDSWLRILVYPEYLPTKAMSESVRLTDVYLNGVAAANAEAAGGYIDTPYILTLQNAGPIALRDLRAWIGNDECLEISQDGSNWYAPDAEDHADVLIWDELSVDGTASLYMRRTYPADMDSAWSVLTELCFAWNGM